MAKPKKLSTKERLKAVAGVAVLTYKAAPFAVFIQLVGSIIDSVLPIIITYFAALTTTELANAVMGVEGAGDRVILYVIITALLGMSMTAWSSIKQYITEIMRYRIEGAVTDRMYEHFLRLDFWKYDEKATIDTYDKATRFASFFPYIFDRLSTVVTQFITMIAGLVALILVSWWLGLIAVVAVIPGIIIQFRLSRAQNEHWNKNVETRRARGIIEWNLLQPEFMAELRLYGVIRHLMTLRSKLRDKDDKQRIEFERQYIFKRLGANAIEAGAELTALIWTVIQIVNHALPIGQFIYVQQVVGRALNGANGFVSAVNSVDEDLANLVDYQQFMEMPEAVGGAKRFRGVPASITFENVSFRYPKMENDVLRHISFEIKRGQHIAIVGENGAGKSTLIKLLAGLYSPTEGSVLLDGTPLQQYDIASWHRHIAVLQQHSLSFQFATARDNVYFGDVSAGVDEQRLNKAIDDSESREFLEKLPKGVDNFVVTWMEDDEGNKGVDLSGGQQQRLALARNFYRNSPIIILDEPTSAIDALAEDRIFRRLLSDKTKTIVTVSHRLSTVKRADIIYMFEDGQIVEQGTHKELIERKGAYYHMFESQL